MLQREKETFSWLESAFDEGIKHVEHGEACWPYCKKAKESGKYTVFDFFVHVVRFIFLDVKNFVLIGFKPF